MTPIVLLQDLDQRDVDIAGGKGANLGALIGAGFPVPAGFVLTTAAYDGFVTAHGLEVNGRSWESFVSDPGNTPEDQIVTELFLPVR